MALKVLESTKKKVFIITEMTQLIMSCVFMKIRILPIHFRMESFRVRVQNTDRRKTPENARVLYSENKIKIMSLICKQ